MPIRFEISGQHTLEAITLAMGEAPARQKEIARLAIERIAESGVAAICAAMQTSIYTGVLWQSVSYDLAESGAETTVEIGPTLKRGRWDAGLLLEVGTGPNPRAPWGPIKAWAESKGLPPGPVWMKIKREGTDAHPFLEKALADLEPVLVSEAERLAGMLAEAIVGAAPSESGEAPGL